MKIDTAATFLPTVFAKAVTILLGEGDDTLNLGATGPGSYLSTKSTFSADGGAGTNTLTSDTENVFAKTPTFTNFPP